MLTKSEQQYLLEQYKKYDIPVYYWSVAKDVYKTDTSTTVSTFYDIEDSVVDAIWDIF